MKRFTETTKWEDPWFRRLKPKYKAFLLYLFDRCDSAGVWVVDMDLAATYIGEKISREDAVKAFDGRVVEIGNGKWLLPQFVSFQYGILSTACHPHKRIVENLERHGLQVINGKTTLMTTLPTTLPMGSLATLEEEDKEGIKPESSVGEWEICLGGKTRVLIPERLRTPECKAAILTWLDYKKEQRFTYKETGLKQSLSEWATNYDALSLPDAIRFSISNAWKGIHPRSKTPENGNQAPKKAHSIFELKTVREAKELRARELKNRYASEGPLSTDWSSEEKRKEYFAIRKEIKAIDEQISKAA